MATGTPGTPRFKCCGLLILYFVRLVVGLGFSFLLAWLMLRPHKPRYYVDYASLSQLQLNHSEKIPNSRMDFNVTVRNPNGKMGIYYHKIEWNVYHEAESIASSYLPPFYQRHKKTTFLHPVFTGNGTAKGLGALDQRNLSRGPLEMKLELHAKVRFRVWFCKTWDFKMRVECDHVYVDVYQDNSHGGNSYNRTTCSVHF